MPLTKRDENTKSMPPKKKAKMLSDSNPELEAEAFVKKYLKYLLFGAHISANTFLLKVLHEKASTGGRPRFKKAWLDTGLAIQKCDYEIRSGKRAIKLREEEMERCRKGVRKSSAEVFDKMIAEVIDKALEDEGLRMKALKADVAKKFFDAVKSKGMREAYSSLPKDAEIHLGADGVLRVNGKIREDFHARGCPFKLTLGGKTWVVDGTLGVWEYGFRYFYGTLTHKKEVVSITLRGDSEDWEGEWDYFDDEEEERGRGKKSTEIKEAISEKVFSLYE